ncbi:MAG TPA: hypothetical protein VF132_05500, partial [Rudaea sp.]
MALIGPAPSVAERRPLLLQLAHRARHFALVRAARERRRAFDQAPLRGFDVGFMCADPRGQIGQMLFDPFGQRLPFARIDAVELAHRAGQFVAQRRERFPIRFTRGRAGAREQRKQLLAVCAADFVALV